jgi:hypothetical protein
MDAALSAAGCIVVLWSKESMKSPWVRHEASYAVVRGVYAPVRIERVEIESPYDRLQATDLVTWDGDTGHPDFRDLLKRIGELVPAPVSGPRRAGRFVRRHALTMLVAIFAIWMAKLLIDLNDRLREQITAQQAIGDDVRQQLTKQAGIARDIEQTLQPLTAFQVTARFKIDRRLPGFAGYMEYLSNHQRSGGWPSEWKDQVEAVIKPGRFWPRPSAKSGEPLFVKKAETVALTFAFRHSEPRNGRPQQDDLGFKVSPAKEGGASTSASLRWTVGSEILSYEFTDMVPREQWTLFNGRIRSVPDVEQSEMFVTVGHISIDDPEWPVAHHLDLSHLSVSYSGRTLSVVARDMDHNDSQEGRKYRIVLNTLAVKDQNSVPTKQ